MSLFTNPVTLNNGSARVFNFRAQLPHAKQIIGEWIESGVATISAYFIRVKHDVTATRARRLVGVTVNKAILDGSLKPITANFTLTHHPEHTTAMCDEVLLMQKAILSVASVSTPLVQGQI